MSTTKDVGWIYSVHSCTDFSQPSMPLHNNELNEPIQIPLEIMLLGATGIAY